VHSAGERVAVMRVGVWCAEGGVRVEVAQEREWAVLVRPFCCPVAEVVE